MYDYTFGAELSPVKCLVCTRLSCGRPIAPACFAGWVSTSEMNCFLIDLFMNQENA